MREAAREVVLSRLDRRAKAAAFDDIDIARGERAIAELADTHAPRFAAHAHRLLQIRRQIARGSAVHVPRLRADQPYPSRLQAEQLGDEIECALERGLQRR